MFTVIKHVRCTSISHSIHNLNFVNLFHAKLYQKTAYRRLSAVKKRFYKNVSITRNNGQFEINLDQRKVKTPLGNLLQIPNELLAVAVASEWENQDKVIQLHAMHLTGLCNTVIDNPYKKTKEDLINSALEYLECDTICYRVDEPYELVVSQKELWDPVVEWFQERYHVPLNPTSSVNLSVIPPESLKTLQQHLMSYNFWVLQGILYATENLRSLILALAVIQHYINAEDAVSLCRLELQYQISKWGNVEWSHDIDLMQVRSRVSAGILFAYLNNENTSILQKGVGS